MMYLENDLIGEFEGYDTGRLTVDGTQVYVDDILICDAQSFSGTYLEILSAVYWLVLPYLQEE